MKKIFSIVIVIVLAIVLIQACDIVEEPYLVPVSGGNGVDPGDNVRKILLEDYTGQQCPNCPEAAEIAHDLKADYGEQLIILAIHAGIYSVPETTGDFTADYRTQVGTDLNNFYAFPGYPMGMVNRTDYGGSKIMLKDSWESAVAVQAELEAQAAITITPNYNSGTRKLDCLFETEFLEDMDGTYNICAFITESGIISPQKTKTGINLTYEHNHVLRASMNGTWGDAVGTNGQAVAGSKLANSYSFTLPAEWNAENCSLIAFVYNTTTTEIAQAEEKGIIE